MIINRSQAFYALYLLLVTALGLIFYFSDPIPLQTLRNVTFDQFQRWQPRANQNSPVKIINIDDESLKQLGQWPWPRTRIAELISLLRDAGASAIVFDIVFPDPDPTSPKSLLNLSSIPWQNRRMLSNMPDHDQVLSAAIDKGKVVLGFALKSNETNERTFEPKAHYVGNGKSSGSYLPQFSGIVTSLPILESAADGNGALTFVSDADGIVRKTPLLLSYRNTIVPSLAAEALRIVQGINDYTLRSTSQNGGLSEIDIGKVNIPTTSKGEIWLNYSEVTPSRYIPAWKILAKNTPKISLVNQILFIGSSAQGIMDMHISPLGGVIPAVEIHAQALEQILNGSWLTRTSWSIVLEVIAITIGGLLLGMITLSSSATTSFGVATAFLASFWLGSWYAYSNWKLLIDPSIPSLMLLLTFIICSVLRHLHSERRQRWVEQAFSRYISPNLVDHLIAHPDSLELGGRRQLCSFVFTDLVDFTGLLEKMDDPSEAVALLNTYLDRMIAIAFSHQGTLDRIVGDAVAIMFSAPMLQIDHQRRAINCALDMHRFASQYCRDLNTRGISFGQTRIGVHTGEVIVGNFGGSTIFDYRALGDPVNTASRLEGANKHIGTLVCVSEATLSGCPDMSVRPIGRLLLKGKSIPLMVFEVVDINAKKAVEVKDYLTAYELMRESQGSALEVFKQLASKHPEDGLIAFHLKRLRTGKSGDLIELSEK